MTRENKLALVVGFALIVFVGVLVSDHFSAARLNEPADLTLGQSSSGNSAQNDQTLIDLQVSEPASDDQVRARRPALVPTQYLATHGAANEQPKPNEVQTIRLPDLQAPPLASPKRNAAESVDHHVRFVEIRAGESLSSICGREYGDQSLASALANYNGIADPDLVQQGRRLRVPDPIVLGARPAKSRPTATDPRYASYTVMPGESLSEIASRLLRSARRWPELYDLNRDVIRDPDSVEAGTTIKVPVTGSG
ncbi:MAG: LysM peptidoglycan-binding domain-containing protein [Phycisphaerales bacterium]